MDVGIYEVVLSYRRGQRLSSAVEYGFNEAQLALRQDMAAGRLIWYDNLLQDWWCFLRNTHPVFAAFASHQLHVVGKVERYWIYGMLICAYWLMAALAVETRECHLDSTCDQLKQAPYTEGFLRHVTLLAVDATGRPEGLSELDASLGSDYRGSVGGGFALAGAGNSPSGSALPHGRDPPDMYMCCMVEQMGLLALYRTVGGGFISFFFAVLTVLLGQLWFVLAACGCCQFAAPKVRHRWERASHVLLFAFGVIGGTSFVVSYNYMARAHLLGAAWLNFGLVKGASISGAFFFQSLIFFTRYSKQRAMSADELSLRFNVTVTDVRKCDAVRQKLGLPPLDVRFRMMNAVLPDLTNSRQRWRIYLRSLGLAQLVSLSAWCVCAIWLAATLVASGTLIAVYVEHSRHYYPHLYRYSSGEGAADPNGLGEPAANASLAILEVIRGGASSAAAAQAAAAVLGSSEPRAAEQVVAALLAAQENDAAGASGVR